MMMTMMNTITKHTSQSTFMQTICSQCKKEILKEIESFLELDGYFYHKSCYHCQTCFEKFPLTHVESHSESLVPIADEYGVLYCRKHFIKLLKCSICNEEFDTSSWICELKSSDEGEEKVTRSKEKSIAHVDCINCENCHRRIGFQEEYTFKRSKQGISSLSCKHCLNNNAQNMKNKITGLNHLRLSTQQKEQLASLILKNNVNVEKILDESNEILIYLAREIKCTPKCIIAYVNKHLDKLKKEKNKAAKCESASCNKSQTELILDEISKINVLYYMCPPNVYPFGRMTNQTSDKSSSSASNFTQLNVLGDVTNSLIK